MSLVSQLSTALTRIGTEFKAIRVVTGNPASLDTTDKTSLVGAINETLGIAVAGGSSGATNLAATLSPSQVTITSDTGTDAVIPAVDGTNAGVMTPTMKSKLDGIEAAADVTTTAKVNAAGAVLNSDTATTDMAFVIDEDSFATNSATKVPTQQSTKAYVDASVSGLVDAAPGTLDTLNELAAALGDDANFATTINTALGNRVRTDTAAQGLNSTQQGNARANISVYSQAEIGDPETNFVTIFEAALV